MKNRIRKLGTCIIICACIALTAFLNRFWIHDTSSSAAISVSFPELRDNELLITEIAYAAEAALADSWRQLRDLPSAVNYLRDNLEKLQGILSDVLTEYGFEGKVRVSISLIEADGDTNSIPIIQFRLVDITGDPENGNERKSVH